MNKYDYESQVESIKNIIKDKCLDDKYGELSEEDKAEILKMFGRPINNRLIHNTIDLGKELNINLGTLNQNYFNGITYEEMKCFAEALKRTTIPKYIRFAKFLENINYDASPDFLGKQVIVALEGACKAPKTLYQELKKIEKREKKISKKHSRQIRKYKEIKKFMEHDLGRLILKMRLHVCEYSLTDADPNRDFTYFFINVPELAFLNNSRFSRNVR